MLAATADSNIYISAFEFGGLPKRFLDLAAAGDFRLDISEFIVNETLRVLRDKFHWDESQLHDAEGDVRGYAHYVHPTQSLDVIKSDPSDNRILECALAAKSDFIVSGDARHVLPLGSYGGIQIVKVSEFLSLLKLA